uniref:Uncharacterized protein n=1 Tax=Ailuropoda melanoleuca TaxID=9646 RepID=A0A7N5KPD5_AILME
MMWVTIHRADMGLQGMRTGLQTGSQVQAEPGNPCFLLSCITGLGEPPSFVSVTPLTTSSVLIQWQGHPGYPAHQLKGLCPGASSERSHFDSDLQLAMELSAKELEGWELRLRGEEGELQQVLQLYLTEK